MIAMRASEIADVVGGRLHGADFLFCGSVVMDSREAESGSLFAALPGEHVDGHDYVQAALDSGAVLALVAHDLGAVEISSIVVPDVGVALIQLAAEVRARLPHLTVVGITGSQGKTTTKDMLLQILNHFDETVAPKESFNNEIGLPLTILKCTQKTKYLVLEFGATHIGDIE
ncbi:MAG: UDP-N-acetylmuramyl pentapeptide synthase, partial [Actinobacteria bacterium]|nr:UDP-N-acetylmuramyl pentapeptide synthase [Actinomycetota bacterium]